MANTFIFDDDEPQPDMNASDQPPSEPEQPEGDDGGEGNNRSFLIAALGLGGIILLSLICMAGYVIFFRPIQQATAQKTSEANLAAVAQATNVAMETQAAALFTATLAPSETPVPLPTETLVVVFASSTVSVAPTSEPATATFEAMQTQVANNLLTAAATSAGAAGTPSAADATATAAALAGKPIPAKLSAADSTSTAAAEGTSIALGTPIAHSTKLAQTGFADEVGLPGLFIISIILVAVILLARRLRQSPMAH